MKISIITVCKNAEKTIETTIRSVIHQTYQDIEYIIVDGNSKDNTLAIIKRYQTNIAKIISEQDGGIYEAMNKGIQIATGDYLLFLNADDLLLHPTTVHQFANNLPKSPDYVADIWYGNVIIFNSNNGKGNIWNPGKISKYHLYWSSLPHPATFFNRNSFVKNGLFSTELRLAGDYEWYVRALFKNNLNFKKTTQLVSIFCEGGISTRPEFSKLMHDERKIVLKKYFNKNQRIFYKLRRRFQKTFGI